MNRAFSRITLLAAVLLLVVPVATAEQLSEEEFSIELPSLCGAAQMQKQQVDAPSGPIDVVTYVARGEDGSACIVTYSELSGPITDAEGTIDSGRDSLLQQLNVQLERENQIDVNGFEGRSFLFTTAEPRPVFGRADMVVAADRLYQVIYIGYTPDSRDVVESSTLFGSLTIDAPEAEEEMARVPEDAAAQAETSADNSL